MPTTLGEGTDNRGRTAYEMGWKMGMGGGDSGRRATTWVGKWEARETRKLGRVTLRLEDSLTGELRDFVPVTPGKVGIYICGLTTQAPPHLGHVRFAVAFDVLRR